MRHLVLAMALLAAPGCSSDDPTRDQPLRPGKSTKREICPGNDCWGMHSFNPPGACESCGAKGIATSHWLCKKCGEAQGRCEHCAGMIPAPPAPSAPQSEAPPPPSAPTPEPAKKETPKAPAFNLDDVKGEKLPKEDLKVGTLRKNEHDLIVFVLPEPQIELRRLGRIDKLPKGPTIAKSGETLTLFAFWGDRLGDPNPEAVFDRKARRIVVTASWTGSGMMDTGTEYRAYGFKLGTLEVGEYGVWVREATAVDKDGPKLTKSYSFTVER